VLGVSAPAKEPTKRRKWKKIDKKVLKEALANCLDTWQGADPATTTKYRIEIKTTLLLAAVGKAVDESTPQASPSAWSNPDFDKECGEVVKEARKMRRQYTKTHSLVDWQRYKVVRSRKRRIVAKTLRQGHRRRVQQATKDGSRGLRRLAK
jgi:hypothetical protein